jgi:hypothetical protein
LSRDVELGIEEEMGESALTITQGILAKELFFTKVQGCMYLRLMMGR